MVIAIDGGTSVRPRHHHEMMEELRRLDSISDCTKLDCYGESAQGRKLMRLTIASAASLARLDDIRRGASTLSNCSTEAEARAVAEQMPLVVWMGFGIHGDELSCTDAAIEIARHLIAGRDGATRKLLESLVIHLDPMANPDGRERCLGHVAGFHRRMPSADTQDVLHNAFWPGGRGNHYLFDLNRDAIFTTQQEARSRVAAILAARPQLLIDAHEMGPADTFLFASPAQPLNPHLPRDVHDSWAEFSIEHAAAFDRDGISYYTRSWNEVFFPGFFDIWPAYHGAAPILYEQAATSGVTVRLPNGRRRTYATALDHHVRSAFANLQTAVEKRQALLVRWWSACRAAAAGGPFPDRTFVFLPGDTYKAAELLRILRTQEIEVEQLTLGVEARELSSCQGRALNSLQLPAGTLRVRTVQPLGALVRNLLDQHVPMPMSFLQEERCRLDLGGKTRIYDVTAWSLPLAFAADAYWTDRDIAGEWREVIEVDAPPQPSRTLQQSRYGYVYTDASLFTTLRLLSRGIKVRVAREPFVMDGVTYDRGTLLIRNDDQDQGVVQALWEEEEVCFVAAQTARILSGPDLGGDDFALLRASTVAILTGALSDAPCSGALWHLFDVSVGMEVTLLDLARIHRTDLSRYHVLILPAASDQEALAAMLKQDRCESLRTWVDSGGTLIALSSGARALAGAGLTECKLREAVLRDYPPLVFGRPAEVALADDFVGATGANIRRARSAGQPDWTRPVITASASGLPVESVAASGLPDRAPNLLEWLQAQPASQSSLAAAAGLLRKYLPSGAYLRAELKPSHWLRYGVPSDVPVLFRETDALIADATLEVVGRFAAPKDLALSGLIWPEAVGYIAGTAYVVRERRAKGQMILFAADPVFRGYSLGTQRLLLNAVVFGTALGMQ